MLTVSSQYRAALAAAPRRENRVQVFHGSTLVADSDTNAVYLPLGGTVEAQLTSRVTRTARIEMDPSLYPAAPTDVLSPYTAVIKVFSGIGYPNGSREIFPLFTGRIYDFDRTPSGGLVVLAEDLAADVIGFPFEQPQPSSVGVSILQQMRQLISDAVPGAVFDANDVTDGTTPQLVWDTDRGQALDDLAKAVQGRWYTLGNGQFVVRKFPYQGGTPVVTLTDGSGGAVMTATRRVTRDGTINSMTVVSERMDGSDPVRATVRDTNPLSPTFFGGNFGKRSQIIKVQTPLSFGGAQALAQTLLASGMALTEQWAVEMPSDGSLEPGDTITVSYRGITSNQVIDTARWSLGTDQMNIQTRASIVALTTG